MCFHIKGGVRCKKCMVIVYKICFSGLLPSQRHVAMIAEMIHSASLIHDDVIDRSDFRRGKPSVNVVWNHKKVSRRYRLGALEPILLYNTILRTGGIALLLALYNSCYLAV